MNDKPLAWRVKLLDFDWAVVFAKSRGRAKMVAVRTYWDTFGRRKGEWPNVCAHRAAEYDGHPLAAEPTKCWSQEAVEKHHFYYGAK